MNKSVNKRYNSVKGRYSGRKPSQYKRGSIKVSTGKVGGKRGIKVKFPLNKK